jgi:integrase
MGTLVKDARGRSQYWYYCYRDANGRRLKKSTKESDRRKARIIGEGFEEAEDLAKRGNATEEHTGGRLSDLTRLTWSNIDLSQNKKVIRFMQKKTKGKTPKAKVEIPIHEALEEYLLSRPICDAPNAPVFPELHDKGSGKSVCRWRSSASW